MTEIINSIGYSGEVTVKLTTSTPSTFRIHNLGHKALWNMLAMSVAGYNVSNRTPKYFTIASRTGTGTETDPYKYQDCLYTQLPFLGTVWGDAVEINKNSTSAKFTVTVTFTNRRLNIRDNEVAVLQMFNNQGELLAEVVDSDDKIIAKTHNSMITGVNAIYEWKMTFKNV